MRDFQSSAQFGQDWVFKGSVNFEIADKLRCEGVSWEKVFDRL